MIKNIFKTIFYGLFFGISVFITLIISLKVRATVSSASPGSVLSANNRNELLTQVFQKNGSNLYYNTGNIGIGTSSPIEKLQVAGNVKIDGDVKFNANKGLYTMNGASLKSGVGGSTWGIIAVTGAHQFVVSDSLLNTSFDINSIGNVGIGKLDATEKLEVIGNIKATNFISNVPWSTIPSNGNRTSSMTCRRIGSILQINGHITYSTTFTYSWNQILTLPTECRPDININYIAGSCWNGSSSLTAGMFYIGSNGVINLYYNSTISAQQCSFAGNYPAN